MQRHYKTSLPDEAATLALGQRLAHSLQAGLVIYLHGDLGAGKTALTRAIIQACGHQGKVKSPTYTLAEPYQIQLQGRVVTCMHFDLYRMHNPEELIEAGFRDDFNANSICFVEWPEKAGALLPPADISIHFEILDEGRLIELCFHTKAGQICLDRLELLK